MPWTGESALRLIGSISVMQNSSHLTWYDFNGGNAYGMEIFSLYANRFDEII